jgi:NAD(P)-dependent dehydrogenase (short-subunit alcohol dehydrogenase family)
MSDEFKDRVVIISGSGKNLGKSYAKHLASQGAKVLVNGRSDACLMVADEIRSSGGECDAYIGDITDEATCKNMVKKAVSLWGSVDIVINNAGNLPEKENDLLNMNNADLDRIIRTHVNGTFNLSNAAWKYMAKQGYGRILNTSSHAIFGLSTPEWLTVPHSTAKAAIIGMTKSFSVEGEKCGIKVNAIMPLGFGIDGVKYSDEAQKNVEKVLKAVGLNSLSEANLKIVRGGTFLVHENVPCTGEIFSICNGHFSLLFLGETKGCTLKELDIDSIYSSYNKIVDKKDFIIPDVKSHTDLARGITFEELSKLDVETG